MRKEIKDMKIISSLNNGIKKKDYDSLDLQGLDDEINEADDNIMDVSESQTKDITLEEIVTKTADFLSTKSCRTIEVTKDIDKKETESKLSCPGKIKYDGYVLYEHIRSRSNDKLGQAGGGLILGCKKGIEVKKLRLYLFIFL